MKSLLSLAVLLPFVSSCAVATALDEVDCERAIKTHEIELCSRKEVATAEAELAEYLAVAEERYESDEAVLARLHQSQQSWLTYRSDHCSATYAMWAGGSIRGIMMNHCLLQQTRQRRWDVWHTYLTFMDSTPPLLPEPLW